MIGYLIYELQPRVHARTGQTRYHHPGAVVEAAGGVCCMGHDLYGDGRLVGYLESGDLVSIVAAMRKAGFVASFRPAEDGPTVLAMTRGRHHKMDTLRLQDGRIVGFPMPTETEIEIVIDQIERK